MKPIKLIILVVIPISLVGALLISNYYTGFLGNASPVFYGFPVVPNADFDGDSLVNSEDIAPYLIDYDAKDQAKFLATISEHEYQILEAQGLLENNNMDGDCWSNYFEKIISNTPYDVKNEVYVILFTMAGRVYLPVDEMNKFFEETMKLPTENIQSFSLEANNPENFEAAVDYIANKADSNGIVFVQIGGHGDVGLFSFKNGEMVEYKWIDERLDKINSKLMFIAVDACHSGSAIEYLQNNNRIIMTSGPAEHRSSFGTSYEFLKAFSNKVADYDESDFVSIGEAAEYAKEKRTVNDVGPVISDENNLGPTSYLVEYKVDN